MARGIHRYADGVSNSDTSYVSATAAFTADDVGVPITGTNIPGSGASPPVTTIVSRTNATTVVLSNATTGTGSGLAFKIGTRMPVQSRIGKLPLNIEFTPAQYRPLLLQRMQLFLSGDGTLLGSIGPTEPTRNKGAWLNNKTWWAWDEEKADYLPVEVGTKSGNFGMTINAAPTANRTLTLPDATATAAVTTDIYVPRETIVLTGITPTINPAISSDFYLVLEGDTTLTITTANMPTGGEIMVAIVNEGTSYTVTWPSAGADEVKWPTSPTHTQPVSTVGQLAMGLYIIREITVPTLTPHLWGEPVSGASTFSATPETIDAGGGPIDLLHDGTSYTYYGGGTLPPHKGRNPYNLP